MPILRVELTSTLRVELTSTLRVELKSTCGVELMYAPHIMFPLLHSLFYLEFDITRFRCNRSFSMSEIRYKQSKINHLHVIGGKK